MIDETVIIKKLNGRIEDFEKSHPKNSNCASVQIIKEFIQMLEFEAKEQNNKKG